MMRTLMLASCAVMTAELTAPVYGLRNGRRGERAVIAASYPAYGDHVNYMMLAGLTAMSYMPGAECRAVGGAPAKWWPVFTNAYVACGMAAFGVLLSALAILVALLGDFDVWMLPMVAASLLAMHHVSLPMAACGIGRALRVGGRLPV